MASWRNFGEFGNVTDTTSAAGEITITHSLGKIPTAAFANVEGDNDYTAKVITRGASTLTVLVIDDDGSDVGSTEVTVGWIACP